MAEEKLSKDDFAGRQVCEQATKRNKCQLYTEVFPLGMEVFRCSPIRGFLLDITGVLYNSSPNTLGVAIPGSIDAVNRLYSRSRVRFVSNESSESRDELARKLKKLGFNLKEEHIFTPAPVAIQYLQEHALKPHLLVHQGFC
uniref:Phospholysine phosphohistidine inorganic pyrophosphate phosphatase n=2 Tax=Parascaris univalens TaxID=6257 RepID=A0A915A8V4_PARUN